MATDRRAPLAERVTVYDRRLAIAEPCRKITGGRYGVRLAWPPCRPPAALACCTLVVGVAFGLGTAVGQAEAARAPRGRLPWPRQGPRLSLGRMGIPDVAMLARRVDSGGRVMRVHRPPPRLRRGSWLHAIEGLP